MFKYPKSYLASLLCLCAVESSLAEPQQYVAQRNVDTNEAIPWFTAYHDGNWYEVVPFSGTWEEAKADAAKQVWQGRQGHLATVHTLEELEFLKSLPFFQSCFNDPDCRMDYVHGLWLGGYQSPEATTPNELWHWDTGETWTVEQVYSQLLNAWHTGEPNDNSTQQTETHQEDRLAMTLFGTFNDMLSEQVLSGYVVEYDVQAWVQWHQEDGGNDHWYRLQRSDSISFSEARETAAQLSWQGGTGHLLTLGSEAETQFVVEHFIDTDKNPNCPVGYGSIGCGYTLNQRSYWIGGQYNQQNQVLWVTGEQREGITDTVPVQDLVLRGNGSSGWSQKSELSTIEGFVVELEPIDDSPSTPSSDPNANCQNADASLSIPYYDLEQATLVMPQVTVNMYDFAYLHDRTYQYRFVLKKEGTPDFRLLLTQLQQLESCNTASQRRFARFDPRNYLEPYYVGDELHIPYLYIGENWYRAVLAYNPSTDHPFVFAATEFQTLSVSDIPQVVLDALP